MQSLNKAVESEMRGLSHSEHSHSQILNQILPESALGVSQTSLALGNDYILPNRGSSVEMENEYLLAVQAEVKQSVRSTALAEELRMAEETLTSML